MLIYNVPASMTDRFQGKKVVVRSANPGDLVRAAKEIDRNGLMYLQLVGAHHDPAELLELDPAMPLEIVLMDQQEASNLYAYSGYASKAPVQVVIKESLGFLRSMNIALSLGMAVKIEVSQPDEAVAEELKSALDTYLHGATVETPVEFFHTVLLAFCHDDYEASLWLIQGEDPKLYRYVREDGKMVLSSRLPLELPDGPSDFLADYKLDLMTQQGECSTCRFFLNCLGYFKFSDKTYKCDGMKEIFSALKQASEEIKAFQIAQKEEGPGSEHH